MQNYRKSHAKPPIRFEMIDGFESKIRIYMARFQLDNCHRARYVSPLVYAEAIYTFFEHEIGCICVSAKAVFRMRPSAVGTFVRAVAVLAPKCDSKISN